MIRNQNQTKFHYTYKITFVDWFYYYGMRTCEVTPEEDIYWGSPTTHKDKWNTAMFSKEILVVYDSYEECSEAEIELIKPVYKTDPLCLNESCCGHFNMTPEIRRKISESNTGKKRSEETKQKLSKAARKRIGKENNFYGKTHTEESKQKMSEKHKNKILSEEHKQNISNFVSKTIWVHNANSEKRIPEVVIPAGWTKGRLPGQIRNRSKINSSKGIS
jgi:hypothetical protein